MTAGLWFRVYCHTCLQKLHDPTGNCFIQNPSPMHVDPRCITTHYHRSLDEKKMLGLADDDAKEEVSLV